MLISKPEFFHLKIEDVKYRRNDDGSLSFSEWTGYGPIQVPFSKKKVYLKRGTRKPKFSMQFGKTRVLQIDLTEYLKIHLNYLNDKEESNNLITTFGDFELKLENFSNDRIIAFHGTNNNFKTFNDDKPIFFVDNIDVAKTYGSNVFKVELTIDNPVVFDFNNGSTCFFLNKWYLPSELSIKIKEISDDLKNYYALDDELIEELEYHEFEDVYGDLDGIIMNNIKDAYDGIFSSYSSATNYVVFNKEQIKLI